MRKPLFEDEAGLSTISFQTGLNTAEHKEPEIDYFHSRQLYPFASNAFILIQQQKDQTCPQTYHAQRCPSQPVSVHLQPGS